MKALLLLSVLSLASPVWAQFNFTFPTEWTEDFRIETEDSGGMTDHQMRIRFTFNSCIYYNRVGGKIEKHNFLLTAAQQNEILQKVKQLKKDTVSIPRVAYDKGIDNIILFSNDGVFGADDESDDPEIRNAYVEAKRYLVEFAMAKGKKKNMKK